MSMIVFVANKMSRKYTRSAEIQLSSRFVFVSLKAAVRVHYVFIAFIVQLVSVTFSSDCVAFSVVSLVHSNALACLVSGLLLDSSSCKSLLGGLHLALRISLCSTLLLMFIVYHLRGTYNIFGVRCSSIKISTELKIKDICERK